MLQALIALLLKPSSSHFELDQKLRMAKGGDKLRLQQNAAHVRKLQLLIAGANVSSLQAAWMRPPTAAAVALLAAARQRAQLGSGTAFQRSLSASQAILTADHGTAASELAAVAAAACRRLAHALSAAETGRLCAHPPGVAGRLRRQGAVCRPGADDGAVRHLLPLHRRRAGCVG